MKNIKKKITYDMNLQQGIKKLNLSLQIFLEQLNN